MIACSKCSHHRTIAFGCFFFISDTDDLAESLGMLPGLVQSGLLTPDDDLERAIRERLGAGDLPEIAERTPLERSMSKTGGVASLAENLMRRKGRDHGQED